MTVNRDELFDQLKTTVASIDSLAGRIDEQELLSKEIKKTAVSKEELRARRVQTATVAFLVTLLVLVPSLYLGLRLYERSYNAMVTECFITQAQTEADKSRCANKFPGYREAKVQGEQRLVAFNQLVAGIPANTQARTEHERRITELEKQVAQLQGARP